MPDSFRFAHGLRSRAVLLAFLACALLATGALADPRCQPLNGHLSEQASTDPGCPSAVGVCVEGTYSGVLRGAFTTVVNTFDPSPDTGVTAVFLFTADSVIHARVGSKEGDLLIKNAGAFRVTGEGEILDLQTIVGGTGDFAGASGSISSVGTFTFADGGRSEYTGTLCLP